MDFNAGEYDSNRRSQNSYVLEQTNESPTTVPATDLSTPANHSSPNPVSRSCKERCSEACNSDKCPKYAKVTPTVKNLLCNKQCTESCTQATCAKYLNQNAEDTALSYKCICSRPSTSKTTQIESQGCVKKSKECSLKTCPTLSVRSLVKSTDTTDLLARTCTEKQQVFPCAQPSCVVTKSEYYKTPDPIPYVLCPHCCGKIHIVSTSCNKPAPYEPACPVTKQQCSEPTAYSLSSSHLNPCAAKLCIQPTPPTPCPVESKRTCSRCQPQPSVLPPQKDPSGTNFVPSTCPHFHLINSPNAVKSVYLDVNDLERNGRSGDNVSIDNRQQRPCGGPFDFLKSLKTCGFGPCGQTEYLPDHNSNNNHSCCQSGQKQASSCVPSRYFNKPSDHRRSAQFKVKEKNSTLVLYMEPNFANQKSMSKTNLYYDCTSTDTQKGLPKNLEPADSFVFALKKLTHMAGQLLENFERAMKNKEHTSRRQQNVKLKMTQNISSVKLQLPSPDMQALGGTFKYVIPLSLKLRSSSGKKSEQESESNILTPIRTAMIMPQTSNLRRL